jgi:hypothetical protein
MIGELPEGIPLADENGVLTTEAQAFLDMITGIAAGDSVAAVRPAGSQTKYESNGSTAWQVFKELILGREKAAMRVYLGTDAALGSQGGAPGIDVASLFNVASTRIQGDFEALERGYHEGVTLPWCALHGFDSADAPRAVYAMPDVDGDRRSEQEARALERIAAAVKAMRDSGFEVTQDTVDALARTLGVSVHCTLATTDAPAPEAAPAPAPATPPEAPADA